MLGFFRRHQKIFFVVVTFFIVLSFSFFGTFNTFLRQDKVVDKEIGYLVDGTVLKEQKLSGMIHLLENGVEEGGQQVNLLNDSLVHKDILMTGLGEMLALHHYDKVAPELEARWKRVKSYTPYVHPHAPQICAKNVWAQYCPKMLGLFEELKKAPEEFTEEQLPLLFKFYQAQSEFPAQLLHQILYFAQSQQEKVRPDMGLPHANMALFGYHSVEDWFGAEFVREVALFVLNAACIAREEGYVVKMDEAKTDLLSNFYKAIKAYAQEGQISNDQANQYYAQNLHHMGLSEDKAIKLWQEVMHFRRLFHEVGSGVFLDALAMKQFKSFAKPSHVVCRYYLPQSLHFHTLRDLLKFQRYLEIVSDSWGDVAELPTAFRKAEEIMDAYPELVVKNFEVEMCTASKWEAAARISLKETWKWQGEEGNFAKMQAQFPALAKQEPKSLAQRMQALEGLDEMTRFKVDQFARSCIVEENPDMIKEMLSVGQWEKQTLKVGLKESEQNPLTGSHFLGLLEIEDKRLEAYSVDNENFYAIRVTGKEKGWQVLSFKEANSGGVLDHLLDEMLVQAHASFEEGTPFEETRDQVGTKVYKDLIKAIKKIAAIDNIDEIPEHRFDAYLKKMRELAVANPEEFELRQKGAWALSEEKAEISLEGSTLTIGDFSEVKGDSFYKLLDQKEAGASLLEVASAHEYLKQDAEKALMRKILQRL